MNMKDSIFVHNRFDVQVIDEKTGEEKQRAVGYNVVLNMLFSILLNNSNLDYLTHISFGSGTGTPAITDTSLFRFVGRQGVTLDEKVYEYPTSHVTKQIMLSASSFTNIDITEVGFEACYYNYGYNYYLLTHAMLQDSEGNQIVIHKTDTDIVYITATFYCTYIQGGFGVGGIYPPVAKNSLLKWVMEGTRDFLRVNFYRYKLNTSDELITKFTGSKTISNGTADMGKLMYNLPITTFTETESNNKIIKHIGVPGVGAVTFPNHDIFPPYAIDRIVLGTGNGSTTQFSLKCPLIMEGSEKVYVNNVLQVKDADYTIDYENNCGDWGENYASAEFCALDNNVSFGNMKEKVISSSYYVDPIAIWGSAGANLYPNSFEVTAEKPIFFDFKSEKPCNTLKITNPTVPAAQIDKLVVEYSSDNSTWTKAVAVRSNQIWTWSKVEARYWRVYIQNYTWTYALNSNYQNFRLGICTPGLNFIVAPPSGASIDASYSIEYPFKTENNLLRFTYSIQLQRG